jgi:acyl-CoA reductase-like NAD-dependent aldehyde dehydrogenase
MSQRLNVLKTYKLFIDGAFPRSESGRTRPALAHSGEVVAHVSHASRKDLREAVEAARRAADRWAAATAYNRGQILYRIAEMMEGKRHELAEAIDATRAAKRPRESLTSQAEVTLSIDRVVHYAGWADKYAQVLGCNNPVSGPYYNFSICEPTGVVACVCPDDPPLLALISLLAPVIAAGNTAVVLAGELHPLPAAVLGEVCATSDVPPGVVNILTAPRDELLSFIAQHRDIDAVHAGGLSPAHAQLLSAGAAENLKRVTIQRAAPDAKKQAHAPDWADPHACESPWWIEPFVEIKTIWHPASA